MGIGDRSNLACRSGTFSALAHLTLGIVLLLIFLGDILLAELQKEREPNDADATSQPLIPPASVGGTIGSPADVDLYSLRAEAGQTIRADLLARGFRAGTQPGSDLTGWLEILGLDGTTILASDQSQGSFDDPAVSVTVTETGRFFVSVRDTDPGQGGAGHLYVLSVERDDNGTFGQATPIVPPVLPSIDSLIHPAGDQDYYRFEAEAGQVVTVDIDSAVFNPAQPPAKIVATLFDGSQTELATSSYLDADQDPFLQMSLPATGTYFLRIRELRGFVGTTNTFYQLGVSLGPANDDDSFVNASPVHLPRSVSGTINPSADLDHFRFSLTDTSILVADVDAREGLQSLLQGTLRLHAAGGEILQDAGSPDPGFSSPLVAGIYSVSLEGSCTGGGCLNEDSYYALYLDADQDGDGLYLPADNCPDTPNSLQEDVDLDQVGNLCDNCLMEFNPEQSDTEGDGFGDACDCLPLEIGNAPPGEVDAVLATDTGAPLWATVGFLWDPTATASGYEVHRGTFSTAAAAGSTYNHTTGLDCSPAGLQVEDSSPLNPGQGFYYLLRANNGCGKGPLGMNSRGLLRPDLGACP